MTFKKIDDYKGRDELVQEHLRLKDELKDRFISKRLGEEFLVKERDKMFKPITDKQEEENKILKEQKQLFENMLNNTNKPKAITGPDLETEDIATKYIGNKDSDEVYGIRKEGTKLIMGEKEVKLNDKRDIIIDDVTYEGTPGLWDLIMEKNRGKIARNYEEGKYTNNDLLNYKKILQHSRSIYRKDGRLKEGKSPKYSFIKEVLSIEEGEGISARSAADLRSDSTFGSCSEGVVKTVTIPCDPNDLLKRMDLLIASKKAGNTGVDQELKAVLKSLFKKKVIDKNQLNLLSLH